MIDVAGLLTLRPSSNPTAPYCTQPEAKKPLRQRGFLLFCAPTKPTLTQPGYLRRP
jgi:hypothetical protein